MAAYHMRRADRQITDENELREILAQGRYAVISMCRGNEPYGVALSYGYDTAKDALYFHTGPEGMKVDFLRENPNVCASIIEDSGYVPGECKHLYRSVVIFGKMSVVADLDEKRYGLGVLLSHLEREPEVICEKTPKSDGAYNRIAVLRLDIAEMYGKKGG